ncbi:MAG: diguanylate cyclase [Betaproteobacteria bacterium]|nr:diguanylate cyclase [Betaproteobacteria bacterium]
MESGVSAGTLDLAKTHHWVAVNSYRVRVAAFALVGISIALHVFPASHGALFWTAFVLQFAVYPHLMQWRTRRSGKPEKAELDNLIVDAVVSGAWAAGLGFPLWITAALFLATLLNHTIMRGLPGILICPVALLSGALASTTVVAFQLSTDTNGLVTLSSIVGLAIYLSLMGVEFFTYIRRLHEVQGAVASQKQILEDANSALHEQISQIHDLQDKLREQANRDSLTGLFNRRYLEGTLEREMARCKREGTPMTMLLLDIDHFKLINDTYGHQAGDEVLRVFAQALHDSARAEDIVCRYGGEEFLLVLPKMPLDIARERGEFLRKLFAETIVPFGELRIRITASIGIAGTPDHSDSTDGLIRCADQALYLAKRNGRNRVVTFGDAIQELPG